MGSKRASTRHLSLTESTAVLPPPPQYVTHPARWLLHPSQPRDTVTDTALSSSMGDAEDHSVPVRFQFFYSTGSAQWLLRQRQFAV